MSGGTTRIRSIAVSPWTAVLVVAVPFVIAAVRLATQSWFPILDLAMTEFRVRDVGGPHTPLIGLPGRIGDFPDQGSHPGPLSFYLLAVVYRLLGSVAWAMFVGTLAIGVASIAASILIARRIGGYWLQGGVVVMLLVIIQGYGFGVLSQPWNPYLPLLPWTVVLLATWAVFVGDNKVLWVGAVAGSLCAQTHLPYVALAGSLVLLSIVLVGWRWWKAEAGGRERADAGRALLVGVVAGVVCWVPVAIDQFSGSRNLSMIVEHFGNPSEVAIGFEAGAKVLLRHMDVTYLLNNSVVGSGGLAETAARGGGSVIPGLVLASVWIGAFATSALILRHRRLIALNILIAICLVLEVVSMSRIFGNVWFYLTLWALAVTALMLVAIIWTGIEMLRRILPSEQAQQRMRRCLSLAGGAVGVAVWIALMVGASRVEVPEPTLSRSLGAVVDPTAEAIRDGVGASDGIDGNYTVLWNNAHFSGSQGLGLVSELERRGIDAGAPDLWRVPVTAHRVIDIADATAVVQLVTGSYLPEWRDEPRAIEVATFDSRSEKEFEEYERLRTELIDGIVQLQLEDELRELLITNVDIRLFGVQIDPAVPTHLRAIVNRMFELGQETAVFIVPVDFYEAAS